jgi:hypothetical protein
MLRISTHWQSDGTSVSMLVEDTSRNKCFSQVRISHVLRLLYPFVTYLLPLPLTYDFCRCMTFVPGLIVLMFRTNFRSIRRGRSLVRVNTFSKTLPKVSEQDCLSRVRSELSQLSMSRLLSSGMWCRIIFGKIPKFRRNLLPPFSAKKTVYTPYNSHRRYFSKIDVTN